MECTLKRSPIWRSIQKRNITILSDLCSFLELDLEKRKAIDHLSNFPLNIPLRIAEKIKKNSLSDPLFLQFVPIESQLPLDKAYSENPVGDLESAKSSKLLHKYEGRCLLLVSSACAMHCRYCFRQEFPYATQNHFEEELKIIANDPTIEEVILSGGDPLSLSNEKLSLLLQSLDQITHVKRIRFHTRFPIGIPERIDTEFLELLDSIQKQIYFIVHVNHANELDTDVCNALKEVQKLGIPLLCQTVLLKGVNDSYDTLRELFTSLVDHGITPYYLHALDRVTSAERFEVEDQKGVQLIEKLRATLSGYAIPTFVREIASEPSKTPITFSSQV